MASYSCLPIVMNHLCTIQLGPVWDGTSVGEMNGQLVLMAEAA